MCFPSSKQGPEEKNPAHEKLEKYLPVDFPVYYGFYRPLMAGLEVRVSTYIHPWAL